MRSFMRSIQAFLFPLYIFSFLIVLTIAWLQPGIPLILLFRDTFHLANIEPYYGLFSNLGSFLLCITGSITVFSALILYYLNRFNEFASFLATFGVISFLLMADDFFMFHEHIAPGSLGMSEKAVLATIGILVVSSLMRFRKVILRTNFKILAIGLCFFFLSLLFDRFLDGQENAIYLIKTGEKYILEDGVKFLGIATWLYYFAGSSFNQIMSLIQTNQSILRSDPTNEE